MSTRRPITIHNTAAWLEERYWLLMPQESLKVVADVIDAWNRHDLDAALERMHPQCELRSTETTMMLWGHEGVTTAFTDWFEAFDKFTLEPEDYLARDDRVLVPVRQRARGKGSGLEIEQRFYQLFTLRDGMVFRFEEYADEAAARKAFDG